MWDAAPSCSGATAPPPDDANAHKYRETTKRGGETEERHVQCMKYRYRWRTRQTQKLPVLRCALGVPFLQEDGPDGGVMAAVEPVDSEDVEAEEEDIDNRNTVILQYFQ
ncbi:hypothetical protein NDU88_004328 [Pleurodeles waltl]|uniref:Uncharacterized protein n=1 Tax=Pleurodeles waltl TaxID=8319 RepID=A0AAV7MW49_PLEWA|nr:hypothetical protein NDU88_004328 [Pleurodeles waltl]